MHVEWSYGAVLYEMNVRQLTPSGTLRAAAGKLEFLRSIGIDAVWLMPPYPIGEAARKGSLGSYYAVRDYTAISPELGTLEDFDDFLLRAHRLGMKVLLDWVANHTSRDARWLVEKPADWYERGADGEPAIPNGWDDTAKLNYANPAVREGQIEAMRFWLARGVDGFRCDMAMLVPIDFWQQVRRELGGEKPDLFLLAEAEQPDLFDGAFDACYGWEVHHLMNDVARQSQRITRMRELLDVCRTSYPRTAMRLMFTSNHDENSWNGTEFHRMGDAAGIMAALSFLLEQGMPLIYTGQEVGYDHSFAFFDRDPIPDHAYRPGAATDLYRRLCRMKHDHPALAAGERGGAMIQIRNNAEDCLMTFVRETADDRIVAIMNLSPYAIHADYRTGIYAGDYADALTGEPCLLAEHVEEDMAAWSWRILARAGKR